MSPKIKILIQLSAVIAIGLLVVIFFSSPTHAQFLKDAKGGSQNVTGANGGGISFQDLVKNIVNIISYLIGIIAIIVILVAGFSYITSGGDSNKVSSAKSTLIYALIGVVVAALAQVLVHFALANSTNVTCQQKTSTGQCP